MERRLFQRVLDLQGRLRLPGFLFDSYHTCYISLGLHSSTYLQLTPDGIYLLMSEELGKSDFTDISSFRFQRNLHTGERLRMDEVGRIQLPIRLLNKAGIKLGGSVVGEAGPVTNLTPGQVSYWTLCSLDEWLKHNPSGMYSLDTLNATY